MRGADHIAVLGGVRIRSLALYSEAGRGTVATLWLPQLRARPAAAQGVLQAA